MATSKTGRRGTTPSEFSAQLAKRIKAAREKVGLSQADIAEKLSKEIGREIRADTYRKWETIDSTIAVDAILPFCDITRTHVLELLRKQADGNDVAAPKPKARGKVAA
jgi:transcriptional regulator with XRE-family HTH domain